MGHARTLAGCWETTINNQELFLPANGRMNFLYIRAIILPLPEPNLRM